MTGPNWQAEMMNRLDDDAPAADQPAAPARPAAAPEPPFGEPHGGPHGSPQMPPPPPPTGGGWGAPVPPQYQQPAEYQQPGPQPPYHQGGPQQPGPQQYQQAPPYQPQTPPYPHPPTQYGPPAQQQYYPPQQYDQGGYQQQYAPPPQQQYAPPPEPQYQQQAPPPPYQPPAQYGPPPYPQYQQPPVPEYQQPPPQPQYEQPPYGPPPVVPPAPYEQPYQQQQYAPPPPPQQFQPQNYGPPAGDGSWNAPVQEGWNPPQQDAGGWDAPAPDGPREHAYTPTYQDPLAGPLPVASDSVGLRHEDRADIGGFFRRIGRFAAEAAYIAGASGRMQRDVENIAMIRRPIGIGRMIGVIGPVPQSGTSTLTALVADVLASQRTDLVLAVDACPREGKLSHRLDQGIASTPGSRVQLARAEPTADAISDVLAARNVGGANQIPLSLVDCPAGLFEPATAYVAGAAHAVALVIPSRRDDAVNSIHQLDQLTTDGQQMLVDKGLVIIAENQPDDPEPVRWLQSAVSDRGLGYVVLPYDEHLANAWPLQPERLEPATRRAALELTARLVERATR